MDVQEVLPPGSGMVPVSAAPHPFSTETKLVELPQGYSLSEMIAELQPDPWLRRHAHVFIGDVYIDPEYWPQVRPKAGAMVSIRMVPQGGGGGGKSPLRMVLLIAVLVVATVISGGALATLFPALGPAFAAGGIGATLAASAVPIAGPIVVNIERLPAR